MTVHNKRAYAAAAAIILFLLSAGAAVLPVRAGQPDFLYTNPDTGYTVYIDDSEDILTDQEESGLIEEMKPVTEYGNVGFISCYNTDISTPDYARRAYYDLYGEDSGTLLVIDMGNRQFYIRNNGAISEVITSSYSNTISDNVYKYASSGEYYLFASVAYQQIFILLEGGKIAQPMRYICAALLALILALTVNYLIIKFITLPSKAGMHEIIDAADVDFRLRNPKSTKGRTTKVYSPVSRSSGGGRGGFSGGGGGFSGGGGSGGGHRF